MRMKMDIEMRIKMEVEMGARSFMDKTITICLKSRIWNSRNTLVKECK